MRIQRLKDRTLWIAAANDEEVDKIIISAGTWSAVYQKDATVRGYYITQDGEVIESENRGPKYHGVLDAQTGMFTGYVDDMPRRGE